MNDIKSIFISSAILISMITGRILMNGLENDSNVLIFMSMINVIALAVVLILILYKAYQKMENA